MENQMKYTEFITEAHDHQEGKLCYKCNEHKLLNEFSKSRARRDGLQSICKSCNQKYRDATCPFKKWFDGKKGRAKRDGIEFPIKPEDIPGVKIRETITEAIGRNRYGTFPTKYISWEATEYPKVCFKWGIELNWGINTKNGSSVYNSPSLDRIDPTKGYIPGNVRIVCNSYNLAKLNCPPDEWDVVEKNMARFILFGYPANDRLSTS